MKIEGYVELDDKAMININVLTSVTLTMETPIVAYS